MFGANNQSINQYKKVSIETGAAAANPVELVVMLYDGAIAACYAAIPHVKKNDYANKSACIFKAIRIIQTGLRMSLNREVGGQMTINLDALYIYMTNLLVKANIDNDVVRIEEVIRLLTELRGAWESISKTEAANVRRAANSAGSENDIAYLERV